METNNKLREALVKAQTALKICEWPDGTRMEGVAELMRQIDAALAEPVKNCEVGTVDEQTERKYEFCQKQGSCSNCPFDRGPSITPCVLAWAQMPYEEGGAK